MEGPGSGVLIDACLAHVPTTALMSSAAKVVLCKPVTCKWCQDLPLSVFPPQLLSYPPLSCWKGVVGKGGSI